MADWQYYPRPAWAAMILPMFLIDSAVVCGFQSLYVQRTFLIDIVNKSAAHAVNIDCMMEE